MRLRRSRRKSRGEGVVGRGYSICEVCWERVYRRLGLKSLDSKDGEVGEVVRGRVG